MGQRLLQHTAQACLGSTEGGIADAMKGGRGRWVEREAAGAERLEASKSLHLSGLHWDRLRGEAAPGTAQVVVWGGVGHDRRFSCPMCASSTPRTSIRSVTRAQMRSWSAWASLLTLTFTLTLTLNPNPEFQPLTPNPPSSAA